MPDNSHNAKPSKRDQLSIVAELIERCIFLIRGQKVMLDSDLAELYQVPTKAFNQAVKRNFGRFPSDFMFRLCAEEMELLDRSQIVTGSQKHRDHRYLPYAFTDFSAKRQNQVRLSCRGTKSDARLISISQAHISLIQSKYSERANKQYRSASSVFELV